METVQDILDQLNKIPANKRHLPCLAIDTRNGVVDYISAGSSVSEATKEDGNYGVDINEGDEYVGFYI